MNKVKEIQTKRENNFKLLKKNFFVANEIEIRSRTKETTVDESEFC